MYLYIYNDFIANIDLQLLAYNIQNEYKNIFNLD
jgi:hypothetical protein